MPYSIPSIFAPIQTFSRSWIWAPPELDSLVRNALQLPRLRRVAAPLMEILEGKTRRHARLAVSENFHLTTGKHARQAMATLAYFRLSQADRNNRPAFMENKTLRTAFQVLAIRHQCEPSMLFSVWLPRLHDLADVVLPFLTAEEMEDIWQPIRAAPCYADMPKPVKAWLNLYEAVGKRDFVAMHRYAEDLLPAVGDIKPSVKNNYLLMVAMLAHIARDECILTLDLWKRYHQPNTLPIELRLLVAYALRETGEIDRPNINCEYRSDSTLTRSRLLMR